MEGTPEYGYLQLWFIFYFCFLKEILTIYRSKWVGWIFKTKILHVDSTLNMSKNKFEFFPDHKWCFISPHCHFLQPILHYRSKLQSPSNDSKFGVHLVHRILRSIVERWTRSNQRLNSKSVVLRFFGSVFKNVHKKNFYF